MTSISIYAHTFINNRYSHVSQIIRRQKYIIINITNEALFDENILYYCLYVPSRRSLLPLLTVYLYLYSCSGICVIKQYCICSLFIDTFLWNPGLEMDFVFNRLHQCTYSVESGGSKCHNGNSVLTLSFQVPSSHSAKWIHSKGKKAWMV